MRTVNAAPRASILIESMRDIGYSLETALADVIDNSITANASRIELFSEADETNARIAVLDNGEGMTEDDLLAAMRPGSRNPLGERSVSDLGRFGLGLKTASFSQCRHLTVVTRHDGATSAAVWDLDYVARTDDWLVQLPEDLDSIPWIDRLNRSGTLVIWENLDRVLEDSGAGGGQARFVRRMDDARAHLELVFHRFLRGERGLKQVHILLNERPLEPFDPFRSDHPATVIAPPEIIKVGSHEVTVQAFTLPHHRNVTPNEWERHAGPAGYLKNQGFYVYRERRLIIHGTWFGLARQIELTKLARVRIDIPNGLDSEWKIDVKKASARPPFQVRQRLSAIIEAIGAPSKRVYSARGRRLVTDSRLPVWNRLQDNNEIVYRINKEHPVIVDFLLRLPDGLKSDFHRVVELAGSAIPMDAIFSDLSGEPDKVADNTMSEDALRHAVFTTARRLIETGVSREDLTEMLQLAEPFRSNWGMTEKILGENASGGKAE